MGGIMGKDTSGIDKLAGIAEQAFGMSRKPMKAGMDMLYNAISTGGVEARQPAYSQAAEKSMQASSQAQQSMADDFARTGIAGTPFAQQILGSMKQQGAQQASYIPTQMAEQDYWRVLSMFFPGAMGAMQTGVGGMGQVAGAEAAMNSAMMQLFGDLFTAAAGFGNAAMKPPGQ